MEEKDNLTKAITLMSSALKQYDEGRFDVAEHSRREANKFFDEVADEMSTQDGQDKMRFGESRNFGMLYSIYESNTLNLYSENKAGLAKLTNTIKTNPVLLSEFKTYNALMNPENVENPEAYVNEAVSLAERHSLKEITEANTILLSELRSLGLNENVDFSEDELQLCEDVEYIITNKPDVTNINAYSSVKRRLTENVKDRNVVSESKTKEEMKQAVDEAYDSLSKKYGEELTKDEIELVEVFSGNDTKAERKFNEVKEGLVRKVSKEIEASDGTERKRWESLKESIESKKYDKRTALIDVAEMLEAVSVIEE